MRAQTLFDQVNPKVIAAQIQAQYPEVGVKLDLAGNTVAHLGGFDVVEPALEHQACVILLATGDRRGGVERGGAIKVVDLDEHLSGNGVAAARHHTHVPQVVVPAHKHPTPQVGA